MSAPVSAASCSGDFRRGTNAAASAPTTSSASSPSWARWRSGIPAARYCPQPQIENGDSQPICHTSDRSPKVLAASSGFDSSSRIEKASSEAARKPATNRHLRRRSGYVAHNGATTSDANFVQPESAASAPRAPGLETSQKPQTRKAGSSASFVFELDAYCVNGKAVQAKASVAASGRPPKRRPTRASPTRVSRSKATAVKCAAGSVSQSPLQPSSQ